MDSLKIGNGLPRVGPGTDIGISSLPTLGYLGKVSELIFGLSEKLVFFLLYLKFKLQLKLKILISFYEVLKNSVFHGNLTAMAKDYYNLFTSLLLMCESRNDA